MLGWDNTPRKGNNATIFSNFTLTKFKQWLSYLFFKYENNKNLDTEEKFIFINAWNEWAEGTYLEPDQKYGHGYLNAVYEVKKNFVSNQKNLRKFNLKTTNKKHAVLVHIYYESY